MNHQTKSYQKNPTVSSGGDGSTALLLCYPPPQNSMAYEALQQYLVERNQADDGKDDQKILIHIGEYKGLTGCTKFENYVRTHFQLLERISCEHWGTDCSNVTVWMMQNQSNKNHPLNGKKEETVTTTTTSKKDRSILRNILVPCSHCYENESIKRMRSCRTITYCCMECFQQHAKQRQSILQNEMMIHVPVHSIQYTNPNHFQNI